jgi:integrase
VFKRARHQQGSLQCVKRKTGKTVWEFRWYEPTTNGDTVYRKKVIGTTEEYKTESQAQRAADAVRLTINAEQTPKSISIAALVQHYRTHELSADNQGKAFSTKQAYKFYLKNWIVPRWGPHSLRDVKTVAVESWLKAVPRSRGSRAKIRNIMSALFNHARRYEWTDRNPITLVRQSAKRQRVPEVLTEEELQALIPQLSARDRVLVLLDACTGLRVGELLGLKWSDVDFENGQLHVTRSVVHQVVGECKTEASQKPMPLDSFLAQELLTWRSTCPYNQNDDWVFASPLTKGKQPYWPENLMKRGIRPAAKRAEIVKHISWHTFRRTFSTLLKANGEDIKTVQELLRHANSRITLDIYTQAVTPAKRAAQTKVVEMIVRKPKEQKAPEEERIPLSNPSEPTPSSAAPVSA